jgi:hypothetical protein
MNSSSCKGRAQQIVQYTPIDRCQCTHWQQILEPCMMQVSSRDDTPQGCDCPQVVFQRPHVSSTCSGRGAAPLTAILTFPPSAVDTCEGGTHSTTTAQVPEH